MKNFLKCIIALFLIITPLLVANASKAPIDLTVGPLLTNPFGYGDERLQFSWKLPEGVVQQSAYQIVCKRAPLSDRKAETLWDSGWVQSDQSTFIDYQGPEIQSRQVMYWTVRIKDEAGVESDWGEMAQLEMGLLSREDWQASWIHLPQKHMDLPKRTEESKQYVSPPCPHFRKPFDLSKKLASARLYATSKGIFELQINGRRVGNDFFRPGWTSYHKRFLTSTYDVTSLLKSGGNCIGVILGEGWYAGRLGYPDNFQNYGKQLELLLQLEVTYADGSKEIIKTDDSWKATEGGPLISASFYDGEVYDARKELGDWTLAQYKDNDWVSVKAEAIDPAVALSPFSHQSIVAIEERVPEQITEPKPGHFVFDMGQNMVGAARFQLPLKKGQTVVLKFAEMLEADGMIYRDNYRSAKAMDTYIASKDGIVTWQPVFGFHGFRYVEVTGMPKDAEPTKEWVTGIVLHNDMPETGYFKSSHAKLNQLQSNIRWGQKGNFLAVPTDCPQRDERLGWTGDAQVFAPTANFNFNTLAFFEKWCRDMRDDQYESGGIPNVVPNVLSKHTSSGWGDAAVVIPWETYQSFGYKRILEDNFEMMKRWVGYYHNHKKTKDLIYDGSSFGDWLQPYTKKKGNRGETSTKLIGTAYFARSADFVAKAAAVLERSEDVKKYLALRDEVAAAFIKEFFDARGKIKEDPTQTGYLLALDFDLLPEKMRPQALAELKLLIQEADGNLRTGFLGTPLINPVLTRFDEVDLAYSVLFNDRYPGWFFSIDQGATTMWERWNSYTKKDGFGNAGMNSFNHYAYGAIGDWMYEEIAGLQIMEPGYKRIKIAPRFTGPLDEVTGRLVTPFGVVSSHWKRTGNKVALEVVVPPNTEAIIEFPKGKPPVKVGAGKHLYSTQMLFSSEN